MLSSIFPSSAKTRLAFLPVSSIMICFMIIRPVLPNRLISSSMTRSRPYWRTCVIFPSSRCLRSSMQKAGGSCGLPGAAAAIRTEGEPPLTSIMRWIVSYSRLSEK